MQDWELSYPNNCIVLLTFIKTLALNEFLPKEEALAFIKETFDGESEDNEDTDEQSEPKTADLIESMGVMLLLALLLLIITAVLLVIKCLVKHNPTAFKLYFKIHKRVFYNLFIRYVFQSTLKMQIATCTTISLVSWSSGISPQGVTAVAILAAFIIQPLFFISVLQRNFKNLENDKIRQKIGSMYIGVHLEDGYEYGVSHCVVFLVRRSVFVATAFAFKDIPQMQLQVFIQSSIMYIAYLSYRRIFEDSFSYTQEFASELIFMVYCYH